MQLDAASISLQGAAPLWFAFEITPLSMRTVSLTGFFLNKRAAIVVLCQVLIASVWSVVLPGCANIQAPMGGAKDTIPPVLVKVSPAENTINYKGSVIRFEFSEYIKLDNLNENLILNPPSDRFPLFVSKLRNLNVKLQDTMQPNTTYTINFGNAIKDVNEGNPIRNFSFSFSTGPYIDSLELAGHIINAETGMPDSTLTLILHVKSDDSTVAKEKPRFVTRPNGHGVFHFDHLPSGTFYIFGLKDEGMKKYTSNQIPFAFYDSVVTAGSTDSIFLRAFVGEKEPEKAPKTPSLSKTEKEGKEEKKLRFTSSASAGQDLLSPLTLDFTRKLKAFDSSKIRLTDTLFNSLGNYRIEEDTSGKQLRLHIAWKDDADYKLILDQGFATDSTGATTSKPDTVNFKTKPESEYGSLKLTITGIDMSKHPVLQFVESAEVTKSVPLAGSVYTIKLFKPAQYNLRILYDANQNGIWDTGNYWKKIQPEVVMPIEQSINVKANWDNEFEFNL